MPFWRAVFSIIFCYPLFSQILKSIKKVNASSYSAGWLAILYIFFLIFSTNAFSKAPVIWPLSTFTFVPLVIIQNSINTYNSKINPKYKVNNQFNIWHIFLIIGGGLLYIFAVLTSFISEYYLLQQWL